jgi:hypothetical protein
VTSFELFSTIFHRSVLSTRPFQQPGRRTIWTNVAWKLPSLERFKLSVLPRKIATRNEIVRASLLASVVSSAFSRPIEHESDSTGSIVTVEFRDKNRCHVENRSFFQFISLDVRRRHRSRSNIT